MHVVTVTEPVTSAVTLDEIKAQAVIDTADHDLILTRFGAVAERMAEEYLGGFISTRTVEVVFDSFPTGGEVDLPVFPIQSLTSVTYTDENGDAQTLTDGVDFRTSLYGKVSKLVALNGWPATREYTPDAVKVRLVVGYSTPPEDIKNAILLKVTELFEQRREAVVGVSVQPSMTTFKNLLSTHRRIAL